MKGFIIMSKIAIVTDSTAALPPDLIARYNISVAPLLLIWGDKTFLDGVDIKPDEFYRKLIQSETTPTTSQATVATFTEIFRDLTLKGYDILTVVISSKLSGTLDSAIQAKREFPNSNIELVDSLCTSVPLAMMVSMVAHAIEKGANLQQARQLLEEAREKITIYFAVDTLEYLHKGGRINTASKFLGTALSLKPVLELKEGKIEGLEKIRTTSKARKRLVELLQEKLQGIQPINSIGVIHADAREGANYLYEQCQWHFKPHTMMTGTLSPVIGSHTGPGTVGVAVIAGLQNPWID